MGVANQVAVLGILNSFQIRLCRNRRRPIDRDRYWQVRNVAMPQIHPNQFELRRATCIYSFADTEVVAGARRLVCPADHHDRQVILRRNRLREFHRDLRITSDRWTRRFVARGAQHHQQDRRQFQPSHQASFLPKFPVFRLTAISNGGSVSARSGPGGPEPAPIAPSPRAPAWARMSFRIRLPQAASRTRTRARTRTRLPSGSDHDPNFPTSRS